MGREGLAEPGHEINVAPAVTNHYRLWPFRHGGQGGVARQQTLQSGHVFYFLLFGALVQVG